MKQTRKLFLAGALASLATIGSAQAPQGPTFEVDPLWPKPLPNRWILGHVMGVAVDSRDHVFIVHREPCSTEEEISGYVWAVKPGGTAPEAPAKENDHGMDAGRYMVAARDLVGRTRVRWL